MLLLGDNARRAGHAMVADLTPGDRFSFQGRVYLATGTDRVDRVGDTGEVLGRVVNTFRRVADAVIDVEIRYPDGSVDTLMGTPNHPFWVPSAGDYVALEDLAVGGRGVRASPGEDPAGRRQRHVRRWWADQAPTGSA